MTTQVVECDGQRASAAVERVNERLRRVLSLHFDPAGGTAYWLERQRALGFDVRREIRTVDDLARLGCMTPGELAGRALTDFVPRALHATRREWILAQSGGATGNPVWTAYSEDEFEEAFVTPFRAAAAHVGFPRGGAWLYAGPSGPHIIGRAARALARSVGAGEPFTVDFDPRWARKLSEGSFAQQRYLAHVVEQALAVIAVQPVEVVFSMPRIVAELARRMSDAQRERIRGVHYGGAHLSAEELAALQQDHFPKAIHLSGYGNTLFGCCPELETETGRVPTYFPYGERLLSGLHEPGADGETCGGARGRLRYSRLDETMLLVNVIECDAGQIVPAPGDAPAGFDLPGVRDVRPVEQGARPVGGIY